jgi:hypothetical protein
MRKGFLKITQNILIFSMNGNLGVQQNAKIMDMPNLQMNVQND